MENIINNADVVLDEAVAKFAVGLGEAAKNYATDVAGGSLHELVSNFCKLRDKSFDEAKGQTDTAKMMFFLGCATGVDAVTEALSKWLEQNGK